MSRVRRAAGLIVVVGGVTLATAPASSASCFLGLKQCRTTSPSSPPPTVNPDGSLFVTENPYGLEPLATPVSGEPLYPRTNGHLYFGITDNALDEGTATLDEVGGMVEALGGSFVRGALYWPSVEYERDVYTWSFYDSEYRTFVKHGVRPFWIVFYTPRHAVAPGATCSGRNNNYCDGEPAYTRDAQAELRQFAHDVAARYPLAAGLEYRNEENLDKDKMCTSDPSWHTPPDVYVRNLRTFAAGVRSASPAMRVIGGALAKCPAGDRMYRYLDAMLEAGAADDMDAISWHPYDTSAGFSEFATEVDHFASVLREHHQSDMRVLADEVGYAGREPAQSARVQAQYAAFDSRDPSLDLVDNYDMFAGHVDVEKNDPGSRLFGWVKRKDWFGFQAKQVFCDFRNLLGAGRPLPTYMRGCWVAPG